MQQLPAITYTQMSVEPGPVDLEIQMYDSWRRNGGDGKLMGLINQQEATIANMIKTLRWGSTPFRDMLAVMEGTQKNMTELRQYTGLAKCPAVVDIITEELRSGQLDKIVIFAVHKNVVELLRTQFSQEFKAVTLYGGTPASKRQARIDRFQKDPKCRVFIGNILACGTAITLTAACEVAFVEYDWTHANNAQATMRVHRIGQTRPVRARFFSLAGSTDERVGEILRRKMKDELSLFGN